MLVWLGVGVDCRRDGARLISIELRFHRCEAAFQFPEFGDEGLHILTRGRGLAKHLLVPYVSNAAANARRRAVA
jgi:hypothetical protein